MSAAQLRERLRARQEVRGLDARRRPDGGAPLGGDPADQPQSEALRVDEASSDRLGQPREQRSRVAGGVEGADVGQHAAFAAGHCRCRRHALGRVGDDVHAAREGRHRGLEGPAQVRRHHRHGIGAGQAGPLERGAEPPAWGRLRRAGGCPGIAVVHHPARSLALGSQADQVRGVRRAGGPHGIHLRQRRAGEGRARDIGHRAGASQHPRHGLVQESPPGDRRAPAPRGHGQRQVVDGRARRDGRDQRLVTHRAPRRGCRVESQHAHRPAQRREVPRQSQRPQATDPARGREAARDQQYLGH